MKRRRIPFLLHKELDPNYAYVIQPIPQIAEISAVPKDVMIIILKLLDLRSLYNCAKVNHYWRWLSFQSQNSDSEVPSPDTEYESNLSQESHVRIVARRRYWKYLQLVEDGYFTLHAMKTREPLLYFEYLGRYEEKFSPQDLIALSNEFLKKPNPGNKYNFSEKMEEILRDTELQLADQIIEQNLYKFEDSEQEEEVIFDIQYAEFFKILRNKFMCGMDRHIDYTECDNDDQLDKESKFDDEPYSCGCCYEYYY